MCDLQDLIARFTEIFSAPPTHAAAAPGRVNLIGEHTDYNDGFVLPMAIDRQAILLAKRRPGTAVRLRSTAMDGEVTFDLTEPLQPGEPGEGWGNYLIGPIAGCLERGLIPGEGFDALLHSTVPVGGGLSSSAAIEVATATLMETLAEQMLDPIEKALLCQHAEHTFAGVPCGIMDQFIASCAQAGHALLIDCRTRATRAVPLDDPAVTVLMINSHVEHALVGGEYAQRRSQCEQAATTLGVPALRDATIEQLEANCDALDAVVYRRARHIISEIARTQQAADALEQRDYIAFGQLMGQSHASMRDDFEISCAELDLLVELATAHEGVLGSRMTGGGFGGCTVTLVQSKVAATVRDAVCQSYHARTGIEPMAFVSRPAAGAHAIDL